MNKMNERILVFIASFSTIIVIVVIFLIDSIFLKQSFSKAIVVQMRKCWK